MLKLVLLGVALALFMVVQWSPDRASSANPNAATLTLTPSTVANCTAYTVSGAGFEVGKRIEVLIYEPDLLWGWNGYAAADGTFIFAWQSSDPGTTILHYALQRKQERNGSDYKPMARSLLTVLPGAPCP